MTSTPTAEEVLEITPATSQPRPETETEISRAVREPLALPVSKVRVARRGCTWELPRRFSDYRVADPAEIGITGAAPKYVLRHVDSAKREDFYILKRAQSWGENETYTELFINQFGSALGFAMAHSGLARLDGELYFVSHSFLNQGESLVHFSRMVENRFEDALRVVLRTHEQRFYDLEFVAEILQDFCGTRIYEDSSGGGVGKLFQKFVEMLVFDALVGAMDRHVENWGVVVTSAQPRQYRFAPIFDTARALFWDHDERKLAVIAGDQQRFDGYIRRSKPCIGVLNSKHRVNHFILVEKLYQLWPAQTRNALKKLEPRDGSHDLITNVIRNILEKCGRVLNSFPFDRTFSPLRKSLITRALETRALILAQIGRKGGGRAPMESRI